MTLRIWLLSVDEVDLAPAWGSFSPDELVRAERIASLRQRQRFLARRWMAREVLAGATGEDPGALVIERRCERCGGSHPASPIGGGSGEVWWSASSSGDLAAVAVAPWRVGLDIERHRERRRWEGIARRRYTQAERRAVTGAPDRFLEFWTLKEAYLKALGVGLAGGLDSLECTGLSRSLGDWMQSAAHPGWRFRQLQPQPGLVAAVAVEGTPEAIEVRRWVPDSDAANTGRAGA